MEFVLNDREYIYEAVSDKLSSLGISPIRLGYTYLLEAVVCVLEDSGTLCGITKTVYPTLAHNFSTTPQAVERAIRTAITEACYSGSESIRELGHSGSDMPHFTNKEFIFKTSNALKKQLEIVNNDEY